ncbi:MAG: hypothetical protein J3K34DRAFT_400018 [Monoraphidium minutum]|nr:MAG: hypothetical protein J3K34DRAFT_400018 [Monoraphidium minutum]
MAGVTAGAGRAQPLVQSRLRVAPEGAAPACSAGAARECGRTAEKQVHLAKLERGSGPKAGGEQRCACGQAQEGARDGDRWRNADLSGGPQRTARGAPQRARPPGTQAQRGRSAVPHPLKQRRGGGSCMAPQVTSRSSLARHRNRQRRRPSLETRVEGVHGSARHESMVSGAAP